MPLPVMPPWARARDLLRFVLRPAPYAARHPWSWALAAALATVFLCDLAVDWLVWWVLDAADAAAAILPAPLEGEGTLAEEVFYSLLVAPLLEEAVYRGWLTGRGAALRFAAFGFAAEACFLASLWVDPRWAEPLGAVGAVVALIGLVQWLQTRTRDTAIPAWFKRHFAGLVWGSSAVFALIHLGNYEPLTHPAGVLVVAPQLIGGLCLAYVRTRLGLRAAMIHHAAYNALFFLTEIAAG